MASFLCPLCECRFPAAKLLPCKHKFCADCLQKWSTKQDGKGTCPNCRRDCPTPVAQLPDLHFTELLCHICETSKPAFLLHLCGECSEVVCGDCVLSGVAHSADHSTRPLHGNGPINDVVHALKTKARAESGPESAGDAAAVAVSQLVLAALRGRLARASPSAHLAARLQKAFALGPAARPPQGAPLANPTTLARKLLKVAGDEKVVVSQKSHEDLVKYIKFIDEKNLCHMLYSILSPPATKRKPQRKRATTGKPVSTRTRPTVTAKRRAADASKAVETKAAKPSGPGAAAATPPSSQVASSTANVAQRLQPTPAPVRYVQPSDLPSAQQTPPTQQSRLDLMLRMSQEMREMAERDLAALRAYTAPPARAPQPQPAKPSGMPAPVPAATKASKPPAPERKPLSSLAKSMERSSRTVSVSTSSKAPVAAKRPAQKPAKAPRSQAAPTVPGAKSVVRAPTSKPSPTAVGERKSQSAASS